VRSGTRRLPQKRLAIDEVSNSSPPNLQVLAWPDISLTRTAEDPCLADALSRPPEPAVSKHDRDALTALRLAPARVTQSSTSFEVEDWEAARLLLLPALCLARAFFRRRLRLRLSLLRHAALLA
jgi:hypothetical protein